MICPECGSEITSSSSGNTGCTVCGYRPPQQTIVPSLTQPPLQASAASMAQPSLQTSAVSSTEPPTPASVHSFIAVGPRPSDASAHFVRALNFSPACTMIPVDYDEDDLDYCAVYVTQAADLEMEVVLRLPCVGKSVSQLQIGSVISFDYQVETFSINTKPPAKGSSEKARWPVEGNDNRCKESSLQRQATVTGVEGCIITCRVSLPSELMQNIGVVFVYLLKLEWQEPLNGPDGETDVGSSVLPCVQAEKKRKLNEPNTAQMYHKRAVTLGWELRLALMRLVAQPKDNFLPPNGIHRFTPFLSYQHLLHACLWANQASSDEIESPDGLVFQIVQNLREYHGRWMSAYIPALRPSIKKIQPIPYPTDDIAAPSYDDNNNGWNVLDNPDGGRVGAQCNQLATLYLDVLGTLGFGRGEVVELGRVYTVHNGTTKIRHMMKGYNVHGVLCVDFGGEDWCYDTTMSVPPQRWYDTLAEAKLYKPFIKFDGDEWRYIEYKGVPLPEVLAADGSCRPLTQHLPKDAAGTSHIGGAWLNDKGHIGYDGPGYTRDDTDDPTEAQLELRLTKLRIQITCGTTPSEGYWVGDSLHFVVPQQGELEVIAEAIKPGGDVSTVVWQIAGQQPISGATCNVPREVTARLDIQAQLGTEVAQVVVWVVWAQMEIQLAGVLPGDCPKDIDFRCAKVKPKQEELRNLGVLAKQGCAVGRMVAIATLSPLEVCQVASAQWKMRRTILDEWTQRDDSPKDIQLNRNDQPEPNTHTYNNRPSAQAKLYLCDAPSMDLDDAKRKCKTQMQFDQWLELEGMAFSDHAYWTFSGEFINEKRLSKPTVKLQQGRADIDMDEL